MFFKRVRILDILLWLMLFLFMFSMINTVIYNKNIQLVEKLSNHFYEEGALIFSTEKQDYSFREAYEVLPDNTAWYAILYTLGQDIRSISYKGIYESPLVSRGRFFSEEDFSGDKFLAVVGKNVSPHKAENGKEYVQVGDCEYEIIGVMEYNMPTKLDNSILVSANENNFRLANRYIVSSKDIQQNDNFLGNEEIFGQVFARYYTGANILHIIDRENNQLWLSGIFLFVLAVNNISLIHFWVSNKSRQISIKIKNGYFNYQIVWDICKEFLCLMLCSMIPAIFASIFFLAEMQNYIIQVSALVSGILFSVIAFFLCLICFCVYELKLWKGGRKR